MPSAEHIQHAYEEYTAALSRHDIDAVMALFSSSAVVHDPVDDPAVEGAEQIRALFAGASGMVRAVRITGPICISGDGRHAAAPLEAEVDLGQGIQFMDVTDVMTFDDDGRFATMKAYYGPTNLRDG